MRSLTLLIQLFGREVMDRLAAAGFDSGRSIARAGAERLAGDGGIALPLARRILAVAIESEMSADDEASFEDLGQPAAPEPHGPAPAVPGPPAPAPPAPGPSAAGPSAAGPSAAGAPAPARPAGRPAPGRGRPRRPAGPARDVPSPGGQGRGADRGEIQAPPETAVHVRRPLRRPSSPLATGRPAAARAVRAGADPESAPPAGDEEPAAAREPSAVASADKPSEDAPAMDRRTADHAETEPIDQADAAPRPAPETGLGRPDPARPLDADPFVDDVGLISWMGLKSRGEGGNLIAVADGILDPPRRARPEPAPAGEAPLLRPAPEGAKEAPGATGTAPAGGPGVGRDEESALAEPRRVPVPERPTGEPPEPSRRGAAASTTRRTHTLAGSFWSFGRPVAPGDAAPDHRERGDPGRRDPGRHDADRRDDPAIPIRPMPPRRRAHDEQ
jgi:hypothetical protein